MYAHATRGAFDPSASEDQCSAAWYWEIPEPIKWSRHSEDKTKRKAVSIASDLQELPFSRHHALQYLTRFRIRSTKHKDPAPLRQLEHLLDLAR
jgi:hypothetical protein